MKRISAAVAAMLLVSAAGAADVDRGNGSYFNKPGVTLDAMLAEVAACRAKAEGADSQINGIPVLTAGLGAIIGGAIANGRLKRVNIENCMLIRGWRLYAMTDAEGKAWKALSDDGRKAELTTLVGAETPARGTLLREWRNDYAEPVLWVKK